MLTIAVYVHELTHIFVARNLQLLEPNAGGHPIRSVIRAIEEGLAELVPYRIVNKIITHAGVMQLEPRLVEGFKAWMRDANQWMVRHAREYSSSPDPSQEMDFLYVEGFLKVMRPYINSPESAVSILGRMTPLGNRRIHLRRNDPEYINALRMPVRDRLAEIVRLARKTD